MSKTKGSKKPRDMQRNTHTEPGRRRYLKVNK